MGRRPRIHYPGAIYHVYARGVDRRPTFHDEIDYRAFVRAMNRIKRDTGTVILAYSLMPNHFHMIIKVSTVTLGRFMQRLLTSYVKTFNNRHNRTGHLFGARHDAKLCLTDNYLVKLIRYVQNNPVRAGLVTRAEDWPWSSRTLVELPNLDDGEFNPWPADTQAPLLIRREAIVGKAIPEIGAMIAGSMGMSVGSLKTRTKLRTIVSAKIRLAAECVKQGHGINAIAEWLGCRPQDISYYLRKNSANSDA